MADTSQVEAAVVTLLGSTLYPNGAYVLNSQGQPTVNSQGQPITISSVLNAPANIERGWPTEADVRYAVKNGMVLIRVHAVMGLSKDETRFPRDWLDQPNPAQTLTATLDSSLLVVTYAGTPAPGQFTAVLWGGVGYAYAVTDSDTLESIAAGIAHQIPGATAIAGVLTLPQSYPDVEVIVTLGGPTMVEAARQAQMFTIATWSPTPALRDLTMQAIYPALAYNFRLGLQDGSFATLMDLQATGPDDEPSRAKEWRRDLRCNYDFPVTLTVQAPAVTVTVLPFTPAPSSSPITTLYNV